MRAIAQYGRYGIQIRPQRQQGMGDGSIQVTQDPIYALFDPDALVFEAEMERALKIFSFRGRFQHFDEATPADVTYRLSVLDTEAQGWDDETREIVETELRRKETITNSFFISEQLPIPPPYPTWDTSERPAFELVADLVEKGYDLQEVLGYERSYGPKRELVLEALEETIKARALETIEA